MSQRGKLEKVRAPYILLTTEYSEQRPPLGTSLVGQKSCLNLKLSGDFPGGPVVKTQLPLLGSPV